MKFVVLGCGRLGAKLAETLDTLGHDVTIVDVNPDAFRRIGEDFRGSAVVGTGIDEDVLRRAGIESARGFAAVTDDDNANIMAAQIAKRVFNVPRVTTRIFDPARQDVFNSLGLETVAPITLGAQKLMKMIEQDRPLGSCD